jgi:hypothetical protein
LDNVRNYNNAFAFTSLGVNIDRSVWGQVGVHSFRIQGELYHRIGPLLPSNGDKPAFAQLYVYDADATQQVLQRMSNHASLLSGNLVRQIQDTLYQSNPFSKIFRTASERLQTDLPGHSLVLLTVDSQTLDHRRYNHPSAHELAILSIGSEDDHQVGARSQHIQIQLHDGRL